MIDTREKRVSNKQDRLQGLTDREVGVEQRTAQKQCPKRTKTKRDNESETRVARDAAPFFLIIIIGVVFNLLAKIKNTHGLYTPSHVTSYSL